ncbi:MAG: GDP-mannose 4,6-dehydratase [Candidatus Eisenbacteria bacterium]
MSDRLAVVTGAAGFIGSHLSERLLKDGWRVRGIDCFTSYYDPALKERNLARLSGHPNFSLERVDLRTVELAALLSGAEVVWHLAAQAGVRSSWGAEFQTYTSINVNATQRILEAARLSPPRMVVYASSSSVYGEAPVFPAAEAGPLRPISPYGVTKLAGEHLVSLYARAYGLAACSLRYFTVYGPRQRPDMGFHKFLRAIYEQRPLPIYGDGTQTRDFTFIDDITEANLLAAERGRPGEAYNVSGGSRVQLLEVIRTMEDAAGTGAKLEFLPKQPGDPANTGGDASLARDTLGYRPTVDLATGLKRMAGWMREYLAGRPE